MIRNYTNETFLSYRSKCKRRLIVLHFRTATKQLLEIKKIKLLYYRIGKSFKQIYVGVATHLGANTFPGVSFLNVFSSMIFTFKRKFIR